MLCHVSAKFIPSIDIEANGRHHGDFFLNRARSSRSKSTNLSTDSAGTRLAASACRAEWSCRLHWGLQPWTFPMQKVSLGFQSKCNLLSSCRHKQDIRTENNHSARCSATTKASATEHNIPVLLPKRRRKEQKDSKGSPESMA